MQPITLTVFIAWLITAGGASAAFAFLAERLDIFQKLDSKAKSWVTLGCTLVISLSAFAVMTYVPAAILDQIAPWFQIAGAVFASWLASQAAHKIDPLRK